MMVKVCDEERWFGRMERVKSVVLLPLYVRTRVLEVPNPAGTIFGLGQAPGIEPMKLLSLVKESHGMR